MIFGLFTLAGHPWLYLFLWLLPDMTVWRVMNRLPCHRRARRNEAARDRPATTPSVRQHWLARFSIVPYHTGWHLAHHVDSGIPFRKLPALHEELGLACSL